MDGTLVLAGDIGGTKARLALYGAAGGRLEVRRTFDCAVRDYRRLEEIIRQFIGSERVSVACLGVPGPRYQETIRMANLPWVLNGDELASTLGIQRVYLLNDLEANAYGISKLPPDEIYTLNEGDGCPTGNRALIAAGTGLGESFLTWDGQSHVSHPSEGGHVDFAPCNDDEVDLLRYLRQKYGGRVSVERVVSGMGIANIYEFLRDGRGMNEPGWLAEELVAAEDTNAVITCNALAGRSALCEKTLDMFVRAYGAKAGNLGLSVLSSGGLYAGGGIAPLILEKLKDGTFMHAFLDKGRLGRLLAAMPVHVILDSTTALKGAAAYAEARIANFVDSEPE